MVPASVAGVAGAFRRANKRSNSEAIAHQKTRHTPALSEHLPICGALLGIGPRFRFSRRHHALK
jgi:hypothetical protein